MVPKGEIIVICHCNNFSVEGPIQKSNERGRANRIVANIQLFSVDLFSRVGEGANWDINISMRVSASTSDSSGP